MTILQFSNEPRLGYGLDDRGSIPGSSNEGFFSSPLHPDQLWGLPSLLSSGYWGLFPQV